MQDIERLHDALSVLPGLTVLAAKVNDDGRLFFTLAAKRADGDAWNIAVHSVAWRIETGDSFIGIDDAEHAPHRVDVLRGDNCGTSLSRRPPCKLSSSSLNAVLSSFR